MNDTKTSFHLTDFEKLSIYCNSNRNVTSLYNYIHRELNIEMKNSNSNLTKSSYKSILKGLLCVGGKLNLSNYKRNEIFQKFANSVNGKFSGLISTDLAHYNKMGDNIHLSILVEVPKTVQAFINRTKHMKKKVGVCILLETYCDRQYVNNIEDELEWSRFKMNFKSPKNITEKSH